MAERNPTLDDQEITIQNPEERKPYLKPEIIHELELEIRTGSPINLDPFDPFSE